jgi:hypothetical protein
MHGKCNNATYINTVSAFTALYVSKLCRVFFRERTVHFFFISYVQEVMAVPLVPFEMNHRVGKMKQKNILSHYNILIKLANLFSFSF